MSSELARVSDFQILDRNYKIRLLKWRELTQSGVFVCKRTASSVQCWYWKQILRFRTCSEASCSLTLAVCCLHLALAGWSREFSKKEMLTQEAWNLPIIGLHEPLVWCFRSIHVSLPLYLLFRLLSFYVMPLSALFAASAYWSDTLSKQEI